MEQKFLVEMMRKELVDNFPAEHLWFLRNQREFLEGAYPEQLNTKDRKEALLEMARAGVAKPPIGSSLYHSLGYYLRRNLRAGYDQSFVDDLRKIAPKWLMTTKQIKQMELIDMAFRGGDRPGQRTKVGRNLTNYTAPSCHCFDPNFTAVLRNLAPKWFSVTWKMKGRDSSSPSSKKRRLLKLANANSTRPERNSKLGQALARYTQPSQETFDSEFAAQIYKSAPQWLKIRNLKNYNFEG